MTRFLIALWLALLSGPAVASPAPDRCSLDCALHDSTPISHQEEGRVASGGACDTYAAELEIDALSGASPAPRDACELQAANPTSGRPRQLPGRTFYDDLPGEPLLSAAPPIGRYRRLEAMERNLVRLANATSTGARSSRPRSRPHPPHPFRRTHAVRR